MYQKHKHQKLNKLTLIPYHDVIYKYNKRHIYEFIFIREDGKNVCEMCENGLALKIETPLSVFILISYHFQFSRCIPFFTLIRSLSLCRSLYLFLSLL